MACVAEMAFYAVVKDELTDEVDGAMGLEAFLEATEALTSWVFRWA